MAVPFYKIFKNRISRHFLLALMVFYTGSSFSHELLANADGTEIQDSRFEIFTAEHEAVVKGGKVVKVKSIFKIDLQTGTVWRYRQGVDQKGKTYEEFFEVPNQ